MTLAPAGFFVLRVPLLPIDELLALGDAPRAKLRTLVERPEVREALLVASSSLHASLPVWLEAPDSERGRRVERSLWKYVARLCARPTPFGLFAGCATGAVGATTSLTVAPRERAFRHTRLDCDYVVSLVEELAAQPALRPRLRLFPNGSLYRIGGRIRYVEARSEKQGRVYQLSAVDPSPHIDAALARAERGARPEELARAVVALDPEVELEEARAFVDDLVSAQVLVHDLQPCMTGPEPVPEIAERLVALEGPEAGDAAAVLRRAQARLEALDAGGLGNTPDAYQAVARELEGLPAKIEPDRLVQVDLFRRVEGTLGEGVVREVLRGIEVLRRIAPAPKRPLEDFVDRFVERWETAEVPLLEVLDEESGIGFVENRGGDASPLIAGLPFARAEEPKVTWGDRERFLLCRVMEAARTGARTLELGEAELRQLESRTPPPLPPGASVMLRLDARGQVLIEGAGGPTGAFLLGRFCHGDPELAAAVARLTGVEQEHEPDAVLAEIVHVPQGRLGNVILRPVLRGYEIPFLARSGAPADRQIALQDLLVSVDRGKVRLRSRRLGKTIRPCLTNAHNYERADNLGIYRFLCALVGRSWLSWSWGPLEHAPFLPRVQAGRVILTLARWNLDEAACKRAPAELRRELGLPRLVGLADGDHVLPIDLDNEALLDVLAQELKGRKQARLIELFPAPDDICVTGPEGRFAHEIVLPLVATSTGAAARPAEPARPPAAGAIARQLLPGGEWLYAKLYTGTATADRILVEEIGPLVEELTSSGAIDRWFFLRFADPRWHVRLRLHGEPGRLIGEVLPALSARVQAPLGDGRLEKLVFDTYQREIERYGGEEAMLISEEIFWIDSECVLAIVGELSVEEGADARWRLALAGIDRLLEDLGLDEASRLRVLERVRDDFAREHRVDGPFKKQLGDRFRKERADLELLLDPAGAEEHPLGLGLDLLAERSARLRPLAARLRAAGASAESLGPSYIHMHANRLLRSSQRAHELVLYDFLCRLLESRQKRRKS
jgi:lantibiotic biosynthesis protein